MHNHIEVPVDLIVPEPDYPEAQSFKKRCPFSIMTALLPGAVCGAIDFDNKLFLNTEEIDDIAPAGHLPPEFESGQLSVA